MNRKNMLELIKRAIVKFSHTKFGRKTWKLVVILINSHYVRRLLIKALRVDVKTPSNYYTVFPKIHKSYTIKNALIVMPFYGNDAVGKNIDTKISALKSMGFTIHVVIFNNSPWHSHDSNWDFTYNIKSQDGRFGKLKKDVNQQIIPDGNNIDDWVDDEICQFISALSAMNKFDIAIINYVFLSKLCLYLNHETVSIIDTHDVFAKRNTRMSKIGISEDKFYFSTSQNEETVGLSRADYVFAIQEAEGNYFRETVKSTVLVQPPILDVNFIRYEPQKGTKIIVGFMASGHYPNVVAINNFIECLSKLNHNVQLNISGTICGAMFEAKHPPFVHILGFCDHLEDFYKSCDIVVNPDELLSGMKVKCLEALSFGIPLVATKVSMEGIESIEHYHQLESVYECAKFIAELEKDKLPIMSIKSKDTFIAFKNRYNFNSTLKQVLNKNE
ncbi:sugar transferase%2C PEP-CTERM/EpsH1 system associated [Yersinia frederiksenii]|nr:sugar transferase%2C PEP-CTERM/EpsH1 system associated [Yersinia frederiksenii]